MQDPNCRLDWLNELDEEKLNKYFTNDAKLVYEHCGLDVLIRLWEKLSSLNLYLSDKPLMDLRREYVRRFYVKTKDGNNSKELAVKLGVSEQFVYLALTDKNGSRPEDPTLFDLKE